MGIYRRPGERVDSGAYLALWVVTIALVVVVAAGGWFGIEARAVRQQEKADQNRLLELRVAHGGTVIDLMQCEGCHNRKALEDRLRAITSEYNGILARNPTWNVPRLDTRAIYDDGRRGSR